MHTITRLTYAHQQYCGDWIREHKRESKYNSFNHTWEACDPDRQVNLSRVAYRKMLRTEKKIIKYVRDLEALLEANGLSLEQARKDALI